MESRRAAILLGIVLLIVYHRFLGSGSVPPPPKEQPVGNPPPPQVAAAVGGDAGNNKVSTPPQVTAVGGDTIQRKGPWFLGTCTGTKGSGAWLREWIELQIIGGVDHVWVVNDNPPESNDASGEILKHYEGLGYVTIVPGRMPVKHPGCKVLKGPHGEHNCAPVKHCFEAASPHVKWLLFADTDEFVYPISGCSLSEHIKNNCNPHASHIAVRWERFGSSGFGKHPQGLMTENFLASGGNCSNTNGRFDGHHKKGKGYSFAGECRHTKVIYNTECAKLEHAGWIHWPVNTSEWKDPKNQGRAKYTGRTWMMSEGLGSNWKSEKCEFDTQREDDRKCHEWAAEGGLANGDYATRDCCAAGIGYNHYGMKSWEYHYKKRTTKRSVNPRGYRTSADRIDLGSTVSTSVLRLVRVMKKRFKEMGIPTSDNVDFLDVTSTVKCFVERGYSYTSTTPTRSVSSPAPTLEDCCQACFTKKNCGAWTYDDKECTLFVKPKSTVPYTHNYHLLAERNWTATATSGIPLKQGECQENPDALQTGIPLRLVK